jgi:hypothetical protein
MKKTLQKVQRKMLTSIIVHCAVLPQRRNTSLGAFPKGGEESKEMHKKRRFYYPPGLSALQEERQSSTKQGTKLLKGTEMALLPAR